MASEFEPNSTPVEGSGVADEDAMGDENARPQPLEDWELLGEQVKRLSQKPAAPGHAGQGSSHIAATPGLSRVPRQERWATSHPESNIKRIVASILTGVFPRLNDRAPLSSADNVRHVDWICPGHLTLNGQSVQCSLETTIKDVTQNAPLSSFSFKSPYELARNIAVITQSHVPDNWRISRMLDRSYDIVTVSSLGMAIAYYRSHCIHCTLASVADAGNSTFVCPPRSHHDPYHLPLLFPKAVDFANRNPWTAASWTLLKPRKTLLLLPEGFDETLRCFESELMIPKVMRTPEDVEPEWFEDDLSAIVVFSPASCWSALRWRSAWVLFIQAVAQGAELIALPGPQDDEAWGKSIDMMRDLMEETAAQRPSLAARLRCLLPLKSDDNLIGAAFKILADKINLVTGRHFTQSAAKRFWTATMAQYSAFLRLPECKRIRNVSEINGNADVVAGNPVRDRQDSMQHARYYARGRGARHEGFQPRRRSFSQHRPYEDMERGEFSRRSYRGRWNRM
ncbi:hypothetical protein Aduo_001670 [Ancylostoma duodenale]